MRPYFIVALLVIVLGIVVGYTIFSSLAVLEEIKQSDFSNNTMYEKKSFTFHRIAKYNITINTLLPQILENPVWETPIKVFIDDEAAQRRRFPERPLEGLRKAMSTLAEVTNGTITFLEVRSVNDADVVVNFTFNFSDEHAVGEGGPTIFIRTGEFTVIKKGEVHLLPVEYECTSYTLAVHELGHVLGFGHSSVYNSVMWPKYGCLTNNLSEIINDVAEIYQHYKPDLEITDVKATSGQQFINLNANLANVGPKEAGSMKFIVYFNNKKVHEEKIESIDVGYSLQFKGLIPITEDVDEIMLEIQYDGDELSKDNNVVILTGPEEI